MNTPHPFENVRRNWPIIASLALGLIAWGANTAYLSDARDDISENKRTAETSDQRLEAEIKENEQSIEEVKDDISAIQSDMATISANQQNISSEMTRMRDALEQIAIEIREDRE